MKAAILHGIASLKLHNLVFVTVAKSANCPPMPRIRLEDLAERYRVMALHIEGNEKAGVALDDLSVTPADLPTFDELSSMVDWMDYKGEKQTTWALCLVNSDFKVLPNTRISAKSSWEFYTMLQKHYPDAPRGLIAWAAYAHKGDGAAFFQTKTGRTYYVTLE